MNKFDLFKFGKNSGSFNETGFGIVINPEERKAILFFNSFNSIKLECEKTCVPETGVEFVKKISNTGVNMAIDALKLVI